MVEIASKSSRNYIRSQYVQIIVTACALVLVALFAAWWFNPEHLPNNFGPSISVYDVVLFLLVSIIIWHPIIMEVLTWSISSHIRDLRHQKPKQGLKVAFITAIVPKNEPASLLHRCLPAIVSALYEHDTWVLDEGNSPEVKEICKQYGVKHFSRLGKQEYHTPTGKFTRTKGGNHNAWYQAYGNNYDIVAQIDVDFVPVKTFLVKTLGYFRDEKVAFVGTPQIYGNTKNSLIAKGAAEQQYSFYGSVLRGLSGMGMTFLLGANHIIRVAALKDIGHYSAHITEDLITGMQLHARRWKSVYISYPLAVGEGPTTWEAYFSQQMRWAYGCMDILFNHSPKLFIKMGWRRAIYYFFLQQHYFSGIAMALSTALIALYFITGLRTADIDLMKFLISYSLILLVCWIMSVWLQKFYVHREKKEELLLAGIIINVAAWPIWFLAFISVMIRKRLTYKITPKGEHDSTQQTSPLIFLPHFFFGSVAAVGLLSSYFTHRQNPLMMFWAISSMVLMYSVPFAQDTSKGIARIYSYIQSRMHSFYNRLGGYVSRTTHNISEAQEITNDCVFLGVVMIFSLVMYVGRLGFYSDDWSFLGNFNVSRDQSLIGLFQTATTPNTYMRPVQNLYDSVLYWLFGTYPFGYHLINAEVQVGIVILFYVVLRQIRLPPIIAIAIPLVYALLPHYSADRFWYASFQANLSMLLYFFSLYAGLKAIKAHSVQEILWKFLSLISLFISVLSYEVVLPFFLLNVILFWDPVQRLANKTSAKQKMTHNNPVFILLTIISLLYVLVFKAKTTTRLSNGAVQSLTSYPEYIFNLIRSAFEVNYGTFILNLPYIVKTLVLQYSNIMIVTYAIILGLCIFCYLFLVASRTKHEFPNALWMKTLTMVSFFIFILGYAIFFINENVGFSPTGIANRVAIAAAVGVACSIVGITGWISTSILPQQLSRLFFCIVTAIVCTCGFIIINTLALFWIDAYEQQQVVLADIRYNLPVIPRETTLILDGVCPYVGPASVFEAEWDLKGALQVYYHDDSLQADIVTSKLEITDKGIHTKIYSIAKFYPFYPYGKILIYNYKSRLIYHVPDAVAARYYFEKINPGYKTSCPTGSEGNGVNVF